MKRKERSKWLERKRESVCVKERVRCFRLSLLKLASSMLYWAVVEYKDLWTSPLLHFCNTYPFLSLSFTHPRFDFSFSQFPTSHLPLFYSQTTTTKTQHTPTHTHKHNTNLVSQFLPLEPTQVKLKTRAKTKQRFGLLMWE